MSQKTNKDRDTFKTGSISVSNSVAHQYIDDQAAGGLPNSWRESLQNAVDSPGSKHVRLLFSALVSIIIDDGNGMNLTDEKMENILTKLGESTKSRTDNTTYGQFGVGWGQVISKGLVFVHTQDTIVVFDYRDQYTAKEIQKLLPVDAFPDVEEWDREEEHPLCTVKSLDYALAETNEYNDGFMVMIHHYENEVPEPGSVDWQNYEEEIRDRFCYVPDVAGVDITVNGEPIQSNDPLSDDGLRGEVKTVETPNAYIALGNAVIDDITVYSRGLKVCDIDGEGIEGRIVTKKNLEVNLARNDIKHGDQTWQEIRDTVEELRLEMFQSANDRRLYSNARKAMLRRMMNDKELAEKWSSRSIIPTANDKRTSLDDVQRRDEIAYADTDNRLADKLMETGELVLDEGSKEVQLLRNEAEATLPVEFDIEQRAEDLGLTADYEIVEESELNQRQLRQLVFARCLADDLTEVMSGINREIMWGEHDAALAWTDGSTFIALTDDVTTSRKREVWMTEIRDTLIHESVHDTRSDDTGHGHGFDEQFRKRLEHPSVREVFSNLIEDVMDEGFQNAFEKRGYRIGKYR